MPVDSHALDKQARARPSLKYMSRAAADIWTRNNNARQNARIGARFRHWKKCRVPLVDFRPAYARRLRHEARNQRSTIMHVHDEVQCSYTSFEQGKWLSRLSASVLRRYFYFGGARDVPLRCVSHGRKIVAPREDPFPRCITGFNAQLNDSVELDSGGTSGSSRTPCCKKFNRRPWVGEHPESRRDRRRDSVKKVPRR